MTKNIAYHSKFLYHPLREAKQQEGISMKTYFATSENTTHQWYVVDASEKILGRLATQIAKYLRGKHKPEYTPHTDTGDYVIVINADKIKVTGNKEQDKLYYRHTGYPGGIKSISLGQMRKKDPTNIIASAVKGMLPKNPLGRAMFRKLKVYSGASHPHSAQGPVEINFEQRGE